MAYKCGRLFLELRFPHACGRAALLDPRSLFGAATHWPVAGRSYRFRCQCGHRVAQVSYTSNADQAEGPISQAALKLWF